MAYGKETRECAILKIDAFVGVIHKTKI